MTTNIKSISKMRSHRQVYYGEKEYEGTSPVGFKLDVKPDVAWAIPVRTRVLSMDATAPPVMNKR